MRNYRTIGGFVMSHGRISSVLYGVCTHWKFNLLSTHDFYKDLLLHIQSSVHFCIHFSWLMAVTCGIWHQVLAFANQTESYPSMYATGISVIDKKAFKNSLVHIRSNSPIFQRNHCSNQTFLLRFLQNSSSFAGFSSAAVTERCL